MRIAINAVGAGGNENISLLLTALTSYGHPHEFVLFSDAALGFTIPKNIHIHIVGPPVTSLLSKRWWLDVKLPSALKTHHADILLNVTGEACLRTKLPQLLFMEDMSFLSHPKQFSSAEILYRKFYLPKYLKKAKAAIVPSAALKNDVVEYFKRPLDKIAVIHLPLSPSCQAIGWAEKELVKETYTGGSEYFFFGGGFDNNSNLIQVLKAFSQFKKWQRSSMKLLVCGNTEDDEIMEKIGTYKFRDDVIIPDDISVEQYATLVSAAYAVIHMPTYDMSGRTVVEAMQAGTPVIASALPAIEAVAGDAVLYATPDNEEMMAAQMIKLHKDEELRTSLIEAGKKQAEVYPGQDAAAPLWQLIEATIAWKG